MNDKLGALIVVITLPIWLPLTIAILAFLAGPLLFLMMSLEAGFLGLMAFIAGWVFFPVAMLVVSAIIGLTSPFWTN